MLAIRIIATVFLGISCITTCIDSTEETLKAKLSPIELALALLIHFSWRAFVIVALWVI